MRVAVVGSRSIVDEEVIDKTLESIVGDANPTIISGGAKGVDSLAREYAKNNGLDFILFKPYHLVDTQAQYTPRYFFVRNKQIVDNCDTLIAFWDGKSKGTKHAIDYAEKMGKEVIICTVSEEDEDE